MKRLIAFLAAVICAVGAIVFSISALVQKSDDLVFTEIVRYGDPAAMDGRVIEAGIRSGNHMEWQTTYTFDGENAYHTEFLFSQSGMSEKPLEKGSDMEVYMTGGFGGSTSGGMELRNTGYGELFRAVAVITPAGEQREMNLKLSDYQDYHTLCMDINYVSEKYYCSEHVDIFEHIAVTWSSDEDGFDQYLELNAPSYPGFSELFRFPVGEDAIVTVSTQRDAAGNLVSIGMNSANSPNISVICVVNDTGVYCIPSAYDNEGNPLPGEHRDGMGIYHIPWKLHPDAANIQVNYSGGQTQPVVLDCENAENIYPMPEDAVVFDLLMDEDGRIARMVSMENDTYYLTQIDLEKGEIITRLEIMKRTGNTGDYWPAVLIRDDLMIVEACDNLALITLGETPVLEFVVPLGEVRNEFWRFLQTGSDLYYDGRKLTIAGTQSFYAEKSLGVAVFDQTGLLYWGEYSCSIFACNDPGASPYIQNREPNVIR